MISGLASEISRFAFRITPMCSSEFSRVYFSSRPLPGFPEPTALNVSRLALERTTMSRLEFLSVDGIGTCCSATSCGRDGGGKDCVPDMVEDQRNILGDDVEVLSMRSTKKRC